MEQNQSSLFGLSVDQESRNHLAESAKWSKFLAIVGFIICALVAVLGIFAGTFLSNFTRQFGEGAEVTGMGSVITVVYILIAVLYFFPCLFLYRHSVYMQRALASNEQDSLNKSFQNLKIMFRFVGILAILTIIVLAIYLIALVKGLAAGSLAGF